MLSLKLLKAAIASAALIAVSNNAHGEIVFVSDYVGNVGRWDTATNTGTAFGNLSSVAPSGVAVAGLAYDPERDSVLIFDSEGKNVYGINAQTGDVSFLFQLTAVIPPMPEPVAVPIGDGAVANGWIYGPGRRAASSAFSASDGTYHDLPPDPPYLGGIPFGPFLAVGVNPETNLLYTQPWDGPIYEVNPDGTPPSIVVTPSIELTLADIDYLNGDFVATDYIGRIINGAHTLAVHIDGTTGEVTPFLTQEQLESMGLSNAAGIVVYNPVPEPASLGLIFVGGVGLAWILYRRKRFGERITNADV